MKEKTANISYLKFFFWIVVLLVIAASLYRFVTLILNSSFKNNSFSILYLSKESKIVNVNDNDDTVSFISIGDVKHIIKGKNTFVASVALGVPINGIVYDEDINQNPDFKDFISYSNEARLILSFKTYYKNMNEYDLHKVLSIARNANKEDIRIIDVDLLSEGADEKIEGAFLDRTIRGSTHSVEIINGTDVTGLAGSVASVVAKKGYNVVFLQSENTSFDDNSYLGYDFEGDSYTNFLKQLTNFETKNSTHSKTSDVTIFLGADLTSQFNN